MVVFLACGNEKAPEMGLNREIPSQRLAFYRENTRKSPYQRMSLSYLFSSAAVKLIPALSRIVAVVLISTLPSG